MISEKSNKAFTVTGRDMSGSLRLVLSWPRHINLWERDMLWPRDHKYHNIICALVVLIECFMSILNNCILLKLIVVLIYL